MEHDHLEVLWGDPMDNTYLAAGDMDVAVDSHGRVVGFQVFGAAVRPKDRLLHRELPMTRREIVAQFDQGISAAAFFKQARQCHTPGRDEIGRRGP